jgi:biotin carboxyl carrier protein
MSAGDGLGGSPLSAGVPRPPGSSELLRVTLDGPDPSVLELRADPALVPEAARRVRPLAPRADDAPGARRVEVIVDGWRFEALVERAAAATLRERVRRSSSRKRHERIVIRAPLPGRIISVWVQGGDAVEAGQRLCSLEAMKMENEIRASRAGTVERVSVEPGLRVELGDELVVIV